MPVFIDRYSLRDFADAPEAGAPSSGSSAWIDITDATSRQFLVPVVCRSRAQRAANPFHSPRTLKQKQKSAKSKKNDGGSKR